MSGLNGKKTEALQNGYMVPSAVPVPSHAVPCFNPVTAV